ncbi:MAG TPA: hypothetical protein ENH46_07050 [Candidatus Pacearchaeota archaeon]|nr:hypothetical protein [Candidatus Pacearchaeota archaeon]
MYGLIAFFILFLLIISSGVSQSFIQGEVEVGTISFLLTIGDISPLLAAILWILGWVILISVFGFIGYQLKKRKK